MGGEKSESYAIMGVTLGSPPHGRGKELGRQHKGIAVRITPAWAGKSLRPPCLFATQ